VVLPCLAPCLPNLVPVARWVSVVSGGCQVIGRWLVLGDVLLF
jgi:hypothetical protein